MCRVPGGGAGPTELFAFDFCEMLRIIRITQRFAFATVKTEMIDAAFIGLLHI